MDLRIEPVRKEHQRNTFSCGKAALDEYIAHQARQDKKRKLAACFVLVNEANEVKGYYTLSSSSIPEKDLPPNVAKKLKISLAYPKLPVTLLGRLAIDRSLKGKGYGSSLLIDALKKSFDNTEEIGSIAVVADPIDEDARTFYSRFGFIELPDSGKMFLPMKTIRELSEKEKL